MVLKLRKFERQVITTTLTATTSTVTTDTSTDVATTETETTTTKVHYDLRGTTTGAWRYENNANRGLSLLWCELLLVVFLVANAVN